MQPAPVTLLGDLVTLEPLTSDHHDDLVVAASDGELWTKWSTSVPTPEDMARDIAHRLELAEAGSMVPLVIRRRRDDMVIGATTYCNINASVPVVEIGWTWTAHSTQRTGTNTEAKLLMLTQAFEVWECVRVEFRTHALNHQSRRAIERLGAVFEGVLRQAARDRHGDLRDTALYAVTWYDWPVVKKHLRYLLDGHRSSMITGRGSGTTPAPAK